MFEKKEQKITCKAYHPHLISNSSNLSNPQLGKSPLAKTSTGSHRSPQARSISKGRKISAHKLFEKAHMAAEGETFLRNRKGELSTEHGTHRRSSQQNKMSIAKTNSLGLHKEYDIKLQGAAEDDSHTISNLIQRFDSPYELWSGDISSINQRGFDIISETGDSESLLEAISTN